MDAAENVSGNLPDAPVFVSPNAFKEVLYTRLKDTGLLNAAKVSILSTSPGIFASPRVCYLRVEHCCRC